MRLELNGVRNGYPVEIAGGLPQGGKVFGLRRKAGKSGVSLPILAADAVGAGFPRPATPRAGKPRPYPQNREAHPKVGLPLGRPPYPVYNRTK